MTMRRIIALVTVTLVLQLTTPVLFLQSSSEAADITNRSIDIASSIISVTTTHTFRMDIASTDDIGSIEFEYCSNDPFPGEPCTPSTGLDVLSATLTSEFGETGFAIHPSSTANRLVLSRVPATPTPGPIVYTFSDVVNSDAEGSHYVRLSTFGADDGTGARIDDGGLAYALVDGFSVSAYVPPWLLFCTGTTIPSDCASATGSSVQLGKFSTTGPAHGTSQMQAATNGEYGYRIYALGTTMTSGNNVIPGMVSRSAPTAGTSQFGINLRDNSSPDVGSNPSGPGTANPTGDYGVPNQFKFVPGDTMVQVGTVNDIRTYTVSYLVNIDDDQKPGYYSTTLSYVALASF